MGTLLYLLKDDIIMVTESPRSVSSFSKLTLELAWGALRSPLADQTKAASLQNWGRIEELCLRRGLPLVAIATMSERNR